MHSQREARCRRWLLARLRRAQRSPCPSPWRRRARPWFASRLRHARTRQRRRGHVNGDPPIERSALAQSTARREIGSKISLPRPLHQASHSADNRQRELKDLPGERPSDLFARLTTDTEIQKAFV